MGTQLREAESGFRYTPTTTFETFPFPWPPGQEPAGDGRVTAIAQAAAELVAKRDAWLHPPDLTGLGDLSGLRPPRTLTALYNARPTWLDLAHRALDAAVLAAYGWPADVTDDEKSWRGCWRLTGGPAHERITMNQLPPPFTPELPPESDATRNKPRCRPRPSCA